MIEVLLFTICGIVVYLATDAALNALERVHGEPIPYRSIVFFVIFFLLIVFAFNAINYVIAN